MPIWSKVMMSEEEERPRFVTGSYGRHRRQWVKNRNTSSAAVKRSIAYLVSYHFVILSNNKCLQSRNLTIDVLYNSLKLACWRCHLASLHSISPLENLILQLYGWQSRYLKNDQIKLFQKISIIHSPPMEGFFWFDTLPPNIPLEIRLLAHNFL